jgi:hypothetical protein
MGTEQRPIGARAPGAQNWLICTRPPPRAVQLSAARNRRSGPWHTSGAATPVSRSVTDSVNRLTSRSRLDLCPLAVTDAISVSAPNGRSVAPADGGCAL